VGKEGVKNHGSHFGPGKKEKKSPWKRERGCHSWTICLARIVGKKPEEGRRRRKSCKKKLALSWRMFPTERGGKWGGEEKCRIRPEYLHGGDNGRGGKKRGNISRKGRKKNS